MESWFPVLEGSRDSRVEPRLPCYPVCIDVQVIIQCIFCVYTLITHTCPSSDDSGRHANVEGTVPISRPDDIHHISKGGIQLIWVYLNLDYLYYVQIFDPYFFDEQRASNVVNQDVQQVKK